MEKNTVRNTANESTSNSLTERYDITDSEAASVNRTEEKEEQVTQHWWQNLKYMAVGIVFGIVFVKGEVISWFRIQEMFRLQSFYMYGVIGAAVIVGMISVWLIKKFNIKTIHGEQIQFHSKQFNKGQIIGGFLFGLGWAMTGACPGPLFVQIGAGFFVVLVVLASAVAGTWVYGYYKDKLTQ